MENTKKPVARVQAEIERVHYRALIKMQGHTMIVDEPVAVGGADAGPAPQDLLLASLGSCTAITLRMYIDRKMWSVDRISVVLDLFEVVGGTLIELKLNFEGDLSDEQRARLVQIADVCPIHKMLTGKIVIETGLK